MGEDFRRITTVMRAEPRYAEEESRRVLGDDRERARSLGERSYVGYLGGTPVATVGLWPWGKYGLVGNVATLPAFRMKGVGRTMYQTLGFHPVGELWQFLRV